MQVLVPYLEAIMLICFGLSWPVAIRKTLRTRNVTGMSLFFLSIIEVGYLAGIFCKLLGRCDWVIALYLMNFIFVGIEITLYLRYSKLDLAAPRRP